MYECDHHDHLVKCLQAASRFTLARATVCGLFGATAAAVCGGLFQGEPVPAAIFGLVAGLVSGTRIAACAFQTSSTWVMKGAVITVDAAAGIVAGLGTAAVMAYGSDAGVFDAVMSEALPVAAATVVSLTAAFIPDSSSLGGPR